MRWIGLVLRFLAYLRHPRSRLVSIPVVDGWVVDRIDPHGSAHPFTSNAFLERALRATGIPQMSIDQLRIASYHPTSLDEIRRWEWIRSRGDQAAVIRHLRRIEHSRLVADRALDLAGWLDQAHYARVRRQSHVERGETWDALQEEFRLVQSLELALSFFDASGEHSADAFRSRSSRTLARQHPDWFRRERIFAERSRERPLREIEAELPADPTTLT